MSAIIDTYKTIDKPFVSDVYKVKGSKFIGYIFPIIDENDIQKAIKQTKDEHYKARHWCYAWQLGTEKDVKFRANDDGEPSNSAGQPIYGQIQSFGVTNILLVIVRYFGGTKLGVGGLVNAYKTSAKMVLEKAEILTKTNNEEFRISFEYKDMDRVLRVLKDVNASVLDRKMQMNCEFKIAIRKNNVENLRNNLEKLRVIQFLK